MVSKLNTVLSFSRAVAPLPKPQLSAQRFNSTYSFARDRRDRSIETKAAARRQFLQQAALQERVKALEKNQTRDWKSGDVYAPHDLSPAEMRKWRKRRSPSTDAFDALGMNPLNEYKNFSIMSEYMSETGRIKHSSETGLRPVNQRKISKAIRRAIGLGLMPSVHRHPELLAAAARVKMQRGFAA